MVHMTDPEPWAGFTHVRHLSDWQYNKEPDVWSGALWLGAALKILKAVADSDLTLVVHEEDMVATARHWLPRLPVEVKERWPGTFDEFPYQGEPRDEHADRVGRRCPVCKEPVDDEFKDVNGGDHWTMHRG